MRIAVIPARGGSQRIPRKNIREFCGKPMIAWSIEAALACDSIDQVLVSTDDEEIAEVARQYGAEVPFIRAAALSDHQTGTLPVMRNALEWLKHHQRIDFLCCLYATAPFVRPEDLDKSLAQLKASNADYVFSITSYAFPTARALQVRDDQRIEMLQPEHFHTRSQDLEETYHDAGQFYWGRPGAWLEERPFFTPASIGYLLPRHRVQDIDTEEDWVRAEAMFRALRDSA
jgi:pseudaminic acid cytidylyltransferase